MVFLLVVVYFNSHPHEEDDKRNGRRNQRADYFNSHPHEEDDYAIYSRAYDSSYFNSHPHEEDDSNFKQK